MPTSAPKEQPTEEWEQVQDGELVFAARAKRVFRIVEGETPGDSVDDDVQKRTDGRPDE